MALQLDSFDSQILAQNLIGGADSFPLMAVPFFMLAGELMNAGGLSRRIIALAVTLIGHVRGGLGYVAVLAALVMASISGSAVADTAALAAILLPMMRQAEGIEPIPSDSNDPFCRNSFAEPVGFSNVLLVSIMGTMPPRADVP